MERIKHMVKFFAIINTFVVMATAIYITVFWGTGEILGVQLLWQILTTSLLCAASSLVMPQGRELSKKKHILLTAAEYIYVNLVVLGSGFLYDWFHIEDIGMVAGMFVLIAVVFVLVSLCLFLYDIPMTKKMNQKLQELQQKNKKEEKVE